MSPGRNYWAKSERESGADSQTTVNIANVTTQANMAAGLEPASPAIPTAAADKQHYDYDDQKSCGIHAVLLIADERDRDPLQSEKSKSPSLVPESAN